MKWHLIDLHVHTALSPCAALDMDPCSIVTAAVEMGLDGIAITDHNSALNCEAVMFQGEQAGLTVWPGLEVETSEEVHVLCFFPDLEGALTLAQRIGDSLPRQRPSARVLGQQLVYDLSNEVVREEELLLSAASGFSLEQVVEMTRALGGVSIPAHIERESFGLLGVLGFIPEGLEVVALEVSGLSSIDAIRQMHAIPETMALVTSSDAHHRNEVGRKKIGLYSHELELAALCMACRGETGHRLTLVSGREGRN